MGEPDLELVALGRMIRQLREARTMTPAELASAAGIERELVEALEAGRLAPGNVSCCLRWPAGSASSWKRS